MMRSKNFSEVKWSEWSFLIWRSYIPGFKQVFLYFLFQSNDETFKIFFFFLLRGGGGRARLKLKTDNMYHAQYHATCARKPKVPGSNPAASYVQKWASCSNHPANV